MQNIAVILLPWYFLPAATYNPRSFSYFWIYLFYGFVQAKTLPRFIALFTNLLLFTLCTRKSRLCFAVGKKGRHSFLFYYFFTGRHPPKYFSIINC